MSRLQQAPEHRGRSAENCAPDARVPPANCLLCGPGARTLSGFRGRLRRPACPVQGVPGRYPALEMVRLSVCALVCLCARVPPSQVGNCPRPVRRRATSIILPDLKRNRPGAPCIGSAAPSLSTLRLPSLLLLRWSLTWGSGRAPGLSKWWERT